ncbi:hypothetical protein E2C01_086040 [Portunus trituberculatus]|uniref:Uncharacterized protein n=1 Tax=Portunus trituberculatus TaxID=210409 RepID=A0A5B7J2Q2_PORTR|nr:hypothetical protein [Portunus trituberculatus]
MASRHGMATRGVHLSQYVRLGPVTSTGLKRRWHCLGEAHRLCSLHLFHLITPPPGLHLTACHHTSAGKGRPSR